MTVIQSGQPYSVVDYSGAVGSIFYGTNDGITNPIVPLSGCSARQALTGATGAGAAPALNANCFGIPLLAEGGSIDWKKTMDLLRTRANQYPLLLELKEAPEFSLATAVEVFDRLENL